MAVAREVWRSLFARRVADSGLRVIAFAPLGSIRLIAIEPPPGVSIVPRLNHLADLRHARLLIVDSKTRCEISARDVWRLTSRLRFVWYPPYRYMRSPGFGWFRSFLQANHVEHAALIREIEAGERREVSLVLFAIIAAGLIIYLLWASGLIGHPVAFP